MPGRHKKEKQVWLDRALYGRLGKLLTLGGDSERQMIEKAITQFCRRRERLVERKAQTRKARRRRAQE